MKERIPTLVVNRDKPRNLSFGLYFGLWSWDFFYWLGMIQGHKLDHLDFFDNVLLEHVGLPHVFPLAFFPPGLEGGGPWAFSNSPESKLPFAFLDSGLGLWTGTLTQACQYALKNEYWGRFNYGKKELIEKKKTQPSQYGKLLSACWVVIDRNSLTWYHEVG